MAGPASTDLQILSASIGKSFTRSYSVKLRNDRCAHRGQSCTDLVVATRTCSANSNDGQALPTASCPCAAADNREWCGDAQRGAVVLGANIHQHKHVRTHKHDISGQRISGRDAVRPLLAAFGGVRCCCLLPCLEAVTCALTQCSSVPLHDQLCGGMSNGAERNK